ICSIASGTSHQFRCATVELDLAHPTESPPCHPTEPAPCHPDSAPRHPGSCRASALSSTSATPSSSLEAHTSSTMSRTSGCALATPKDRPAQVSMGRSLGMSPNAKTSAGSMPCEAHHCPRAAALVTPSALISASPEAPEYE